MSIMSMSTSIRMLSTRRMMTIAWDGDKSYSDTEDALCGWCRYCTQMYITVKHVFLSQPSTCNPEEIGQQEVTAIMPHCVWKKWHPNINCYNSITACEFCLKFHILLHTFSWWRGTVVERRSLPVLRSTCSWWVTTDVGKPSAIGQPTRPTQPFILSGSINE